MVWIEQPIGVGFTQGKPNITNEIELGEQFVGFYKNFMKTFDLQGRDIYLTGESYGGYYVPYVADAILNENNPDMPLKGIAINDPIIADGTMQQVRMIKRIKSKLNPLTRSALSANCDLRLRQVLGEPSLSQRDLCGSPAEAKRCMWLHRFHGQILQVPTTK